MEVTANREVVLDYMNYKHLVDSWHENKLKESFILERLETCEEYIYHLQQNFQEKDFQLYTEYMEKEINRYHISDMEIESFMTEQGLYQ